MPCFFTALPPVCDGRTMARRAKAALALLGLVAAVAAVGLPACSGPVVLVSVWRADATTPDGELKVELNGTEVDRFESVPLSAQRLRRGYRLSSDDQKICVRLEFSPKGTGTTEPRQVAWNGQTITWTIGGGDPKGQPCATGAGGMGGGAAAGRAGGGGAGEAGGRSGAGAAGRDGSGAAGATGGTSSSGGMPGQGGGPPGLGGAPGSGGGTFGSGGTSGTSGTSGSTGGRGGQPASSGGMPMTGSGGGPGGRGMGSGGVMSSGGAGGMGGITSMGGATSTGGVIGPGTGGIVSTGGAGPGGGNGGGAGGRGGAGAGGMAGNGGRSGGGSGGAPVPICAQNNTVPCTCAAYCETINRYCPSSMLFPGAPGDCLPICQGFGWPENAVYADGPGSALPCRMNQVRTGGAQLCRDGSPVGGGIGNPCGSHCQVLCDAVDNNCAALSSPPYADKNDCLTKCMTTPFNFEDEQRLLTTSTGQGSDGNCRVYWAAYAGTLPLANRGEACANTAPSSTICQ